MVSQLDSDGIAASNGHSSISKVQEDIEINTDDMRLTDDELDSIVGGLDIAVYPGFSSNRARAAAGE